MRWSPPLFAFLLLALVAGKLAAAAGDDDDDRADNGDLNQNVKSFPDLGNLVPSPPGEVLPPEGRMVATPAQLKAPEPKTQEEIIFHCWGYLGHPETILDIKSFFRWGCQPSQNTCDGLHRIPQLCVDNMFRVYDWVTPRHVHRLYRRCRPGARRPISRKTRRYVSYCRNFVSYLWKKYGKHRGGGRGKRGGGGGHHRQRNAVVRA